MLKRVMYVEDEPSIQQVTKMALECVGNYEVCICSSGQEAMDTVTDFAPQIILLDVMMPDMDGIQTYQALHQLPAAQDIPVVFLTAKSMPEELEGLKQLGAAGIIHKPFDPLTLPSEVKAYWEQATRGKENPS